MELYNILYVCKDSIYQEFCCLNLASSLDVYLLNNGPCKEFFGGLEAF